MQNPLNEEKLIQAAARHVGTHDFYSEDYQPALRSLLASLDQEASLSQTGVWSTFGTLLDALTKRARIAAALASHPEIVEIPIERPVFITGFPRTGTTLLHNLLARDSANRTMRLWEMRASPISSNNDQQWERKHIAETELLLQNLYKAAPAFRSIHSMQATWPDECNWLFRNSLASLINAITYYVPGYLHWLQQQDMVSAYTFYRRQLQLLLVRSPGERLVLKDPFHLWHLDALLSVFPDARIVHLHRDILESLPSMCSLCYTLQGIYSERREPQMVGMYCKKMMNAGMTRMLSVRDSDTDENFIDINYYRLVKDPIDTVQSIYAQIGWEFSAEAEAAMRIWLAENKQHKAGKHNYSLEQFGLDSSEIKQSFKAYSSRFLEQSLAV